MSDKLLGKIQTSCRVLDDLDDKELTIRHKLLGYPIAYATELCKEFFSYVFGFAWILRSDWLRFSRSKLLGGTALSLPTITYKFTRETDYTGLPMCDFGFVLAANEYSYGRVTLLLVIANYIFRNVGKLVGLLLVTPWVIPVSLLIKTVYGIRRTFTRSALRSAIKMAEPVDLTAHLTVRNSYGRNVSSILAEGVDLPEFLSGFFQVMRKQRAACEKFATWCKKAVNRKKFEALNELLKKIDVGRNKRAENWRHAYSDDANEKEKYQLLEKTIERFERQFDEEVATIRQELIANDEDFDVLVRGVRSFVYPYYREAKSDEYRSRDNWFGRDGDYQKSAEQFLADPFRIMSGTDFRNMRSIANAYEEAVKQRQESDQFWAKVSIVAKAFFLTPISLCFTVPRYLELRQAHAEEMASLRQLCSDVSDITSGGMAKRPFTCAVEVMKQSQIPPTKEKPNPLYNNRFNAAYAEALLLSIPESSPDYLSAASELGKLYLLEELYDEAKASFLRVTRDSADYFEAMYGLGKVHLLQKQYKEAEEYFLRVPESSSVYVRAILELGNMYFSLASHAKASACLAKLPPAEGSTLTAVTRQLARTGVATLDQVYAQQSQAAQCPVVLATSAAKPAVEGDSVSEDHSGEDDETQPLLMCNN